MQRAEPVDIVLADCEAETDEARLRVDQPDRGLSEAR